MTTRKQTLARRRKRRNQDRAERNKTARMATAHEEKRVYIRQETELEFLLSRTRRKPPVPGITPRQYESGDRLYKDWRASGSEPQIVPRYDREIGLPPTASADKQIDARRRFDGALASAGTRLHRAVVVHVCLLDCRLAHWHARPLHGLTLLREALDRLGDWYESERRQETELAELEVAEVA